MAEIVWESDAQSYGFMVMSNGMVWPDDWPGTLVEAQFTSARGDGADLDRDPDMVPSGPGRITFTPQVKTVGYDGEHGKRIVSLHPFEAVVGDDGFLYTPDEYGGPGIRGIVLPSNNSDVVDEHDWTWRVTFDIPDTTIRPTHIPTPHDHSVDIKDYLDSDANHGVRVVVDRVSARETLTARDQTLAARDLVLPARDQTLTARDQTLAHGITVDTSVGTRVYVGDTMIHGDTGWRDISHHIHTDLTGTAYIKRENNDVSISANISATEALGPGSLSTRRRLLSLPVGFYSSNFLAHRGRGYAHHRGVLIGIDMGWGINWLDLSDNPVQNDLGEWTSTLSVNYSFPVGSGWPASLPGTPL